jgi:hypothetical protein
MQCVCCCRGVVDWGALLLCSLTIIQVSAYSRLRGIRMSRPPLKAALQHSGVSNITVMQIRRHEMLKHCCTDRNKLGMLVLKGGKKAKEN